MRVYGRLDYTRFESERPIESDNASLLAGIECDFSRSL